MHNELIGSACAAGRDDGRRMEAAVKFDSTDWGWVIMSIGMAIGAGIVFLPVQVGLVGIWVYLFRRLSHIRLFISCSAYLSTRWPIRRGAKITPASSADIWGKTGASFSVFSISSAF